MEYYRYKIEGILTTDTPLHIGSWEESEENGDRLYSPGKTDTGYGTEEKNRINPLVSLVAMDCDSRPCIPASSFKGALRARAEQFPDYEAYVHELFGVRDETRQLGGRLIFHDIRTSKEQNGIPPLFSKKTENHPLYWDENRLTCVFTGTTLNRRYGTVEVNKLFYHEVVPPEVRFHTEICLQGLSAEKLGFLLRLLDEFNDKATPLTLGAETAHGLGRMKWKTKRVSGLTRDGDVKDWLLNNFTGFEGFPEIPPATWRVYKDKYKNIRPRKDTQTVALNIDLHFDGPFMVNDPSQVAPKKKEDKDNHEPDHIYLKDEKGRIVLRSRSFHGALRARAERIIRTLAPESIMREKACYVESRDKDEACRSVTDKQEVENLCMACRLFGGKGWRSPVGISDFTVRKTITDFDVGTPVDQDFVGIDRFTGGAAEHKKFKARYRWRPVLSGSIKVDLSRIKPEHAGIMVLVLKDLLQNRIYLGFGRSKGFGSVTGAITSVTLPQTLPPGLEEMFQNCGKWEDLLKINDKLTPGQVIFLDRLIEEFHTKLNPNETGRE